MDYLFITITADLPGCISAHLGRPFARSSSGIGYEVRADVG